jgi:lipid-A-disaccharide synthase
MKYFIIAGEQSGDLHGSNLIRELHRADPHAEISCWGGGLMEAAGARLLKHYRDTAFMGFVVILKNIRTIARNLKLCKQQVKEFGPDLLILIDYPGFNLRIAEYASKEGLRVFYYISPKFWAWNEKRVEKIKRFVNRMYIIFPFEKDFYAKHGIEVEYRGNPLVDELEKKSLVLADKESLRKQLGVPSRPVIALLAGSRRHEVEHILPMMLRMVKYYPDYQFILTCVATLNPEFYKRIIGSADIMMVTDKTYEVLKISEAALVTSGTATLETALFDVPQVVCYRGDFLSMLIAWLVIKVPFISLVNLIADAVVVKELLGYSVNEHNLRRELQNILPGSPERNKLLEGYRMIREKLGPSGASQRIAEDMVRQIKGL